MVFQQQSFSQSQMTELPTDLRVSVIRRTACQPLQEYGTQLQALTQSKAYKHSKTEVLLHRKANTPSAHGFDQPAAQS